MFEEYKKPHLGVKTTQHAFEYNADNMLTRAAKGSSALAVLAYDPDNALITEDITAGGVTTSTVKIGDIYEKVATGTLTEHRHYIMAGDGLVAIRTIRSDATADRYYVLDDHLGSVSAIVRDATGLADNKMSYAPFGQPRNPGTWKGDPTNTTLITRRGFTGHVQLDAVGLIHMKGRCYDPELGRFLTPDPFVQAPYDSQSLNRYSYCLNNPLNITDPTGFWSWRKFVHSVLRGAAFAAGLVLGMGNPIAGCIFGGMLAGAVGGYIEGGSRGIIPGMFMGGAMGMIGGIVGVGAGGINPYLPSVVNVAQIAYAYHREGWDALGYMVGGIIGQGLGTIAMNKIGLGTPSDVPGNNDGQKAPVPSETSGRQYESMEQFTHDMQNPTRVAWTDSLKNALHIFEWADRIKTVLSLDGLSTEAQEVRSMCLSCDKYQQLLNDSTLQGNQKMYEIYAPYRDYYCGKCEDMRYGIVSKSVKEYSGKGL